MHEYVLAALAVLAYVHAWWIVAIVRRRNDVADVAWGPGILLVALVTLGVGFRPTDGGHGRSILVTSMVALWATRLSLHIHERNRGRPEDRRYRAWRESWGRSAALRAYLQVFLLQGALMLFVAAPAVVSNAGPDVPLRWQDAFGLGLWAVGFVFEAVADAQLLKFMRQAGNRGRIIQSGLWQYSRHPNYFGEVCLWWGVWLVSIPAGAGWLGMIGPVTITVLITAVSGIPLLEEQLSKNPEWASYRSRVSVFIPSRPRKV